MTADFIALGEMLKTAVPFVRHLDIEYATLTPETCVCRLADQEQWHNHLAGPHAGALFTLGETASAAVVAAAFFDHVAEFVPIPRGATIAYKRVAKGAVTATATLARDRDEALAEMRGAGRATVPVAVTITDESGETTTEMTVDWYLRRA